MIQIDSREHQKVIDGIKKAFDAAGEKWFVSKLYVGDYMNYDNPRLVVDRKQNLSELCGNVCQQHERFRAEIIRANEAGIKLVFLCEHGKGIEKLDETVTEDLQKILDRFEAIQSDDVMYTTFTDKASDMDGNVKFIFETDPVEISDED